MSDVLNNLNAPESSSWAEEVASVAAEMPAEAPAPEHVPTPEPVQEAAPEPSLTQETAPEEPDRRVPLKALQEERQKRAEYERQVQDYQRQLQEYQAWASEVQRQQQMMGHNGGPPLEQAQPEPDPETDPIGALKHAREQQRQLQEAIAQQQAERQQQAYVQQLNQVAYQAATQYAQQVPDYQDAYRYALNSRAAELAALGTPQNVIPQILQREELSLIDTALQNRRNPAEAIYQFAKARGFQGKTAAPAPAATPDPALQQQKAAVAASASAAGSPASKGSVSVADLANLKGAAFDAAWNKLFGGNNSSIFRE